MDILNYCRRHPTFNTAPEIKEICQSLQKYDIDIFMYGKLFPDKKYIFLSTESEWSKHYISNVYNLNHDYIQNYIFETSLQSNCLISAELYPQNKAYVAAKKMFNMNNGIVMPFQCHIVKEFCYFGTHSPDSRIFNFFIKNIDFLSTFRSYFKEKASRLIKACEKEKLPTLTEYLKNKSKFEEKDLLPLPDEIRQELIAEMKYQRYYLIYDPEERYLTHSEYKCIRWLLNGKSVNEIGIILNASPRTIETHIKNMKIKFESNKIVALLYKLIKLGLKIE